MRVERCDHKPLLNLREAARRILYSLGALGRGLEEAGRAIPRVFEEPKPAPDSDFSQSLTY